MSVRFCPLTDDQAAEMLRDARTAGLLKLHCGKGFTGERQEWAVHDIQQKGGEPTFTAAANKSRCND